MASHPHISLLPLVVVFLVVPLRLGAVNGVMDTVILVMDQTDSYKWPRELSQWNRVITELKLVVRRNEDILERMGKAGTSGRALVSSVSSVTDMTAAALSLKTKAKALEQGRKTYGLRQRPSNTLQRGMKVGTNMELWGDTQARETERYDAFALQDALRERHSEALENQDKVLQKELSVQKQLLEKLRSAKTDADLQSVQAAMAASQQRLDLAREKTAQARDEYQLLNAELATERARKGEADKEWEEAFVEKLRERAMTSLHAQKGENS